MSDNNTQVLEDRMMRLQVTLDEALNAANRRKSNSLVFMVISLVALSFYLMVAYYKVAEFDSNTVILNLENYTRQQIDASRPMLTQQLIAYAPQAADQLEALVRKAPAELTSQLRMSIDKIVADALPELEGELYAHITEALAQAHDAMPKSADGTVDEAVFRKTMDDIAASYAREVHSLVDKIHVLYLDRSKEVLASLDMLAKGQQLDASQQHLRAAMVSFLQLMEHWDPQPQLTPME